MNKRCTATILCDGWKKRTGSTKKEMMQDLMRFRDLGRNQCEGFTREGNNTRFLMQNKGRGTRIIQTVAIKTSERESKQVKEPEQAMLQKVIGGKRSKRKRNGFFSQSRRTKTI
jgi:hypothetical protein